MIKSTIATLILIIAISSCREKNVSEPGRHDLLFNALPEMWDEGIPLGNGMTGALVWQKDGRLRISIRQGRPLGSPANGKHRNSGMEIQMGI